MSDAPVAAPVAVQEPSITVDDNTYLIRTLPDSIKVLVSLYEETTNERSKAQRQAAIYDAASRALGDNVINGIRQWNVQRVKELQAAQAANEAAPVPAPVAPKGKKLKVVKAPNGSADFGTAE